VVCDAGPPIHLDEVGCLDLLADFRAVLIPEAVWQEVARHRPSLLDSGAVDLRQVAVNVPDQFELQALVRAFALDAGEQAALALMGEHPNAILLTDDAAARLVAERLGMRVHGTVGVVLRAVRRGQRTPGQVLDVLGALPERSSLHIRRDLLQAIVARVSAEYDL
jgi:predicted nucleic acid-binding protein